MLRVEKLHLGKRKADNVSVQSETAAEKEIGERQGAGRRCTICLEGEALKTSH